MGMALDLRAKDWPRKIWHQRVPAVNMKRFRDYGVELQEWASVLVILVQFFA